MMHRSASRPARNAVEADRAQAAFDHALIGMAVIASDGRWLQANTALCQTLGYAESDLLGRSYLDLFMLPDRGADAAQLSELCAGGVPAYQIERQVKTKSGEARWVRISLAPLGDGAVVQIEDVEVRRTDEQSASTSMGELRRSNTELEVFAAVAAHDLQEPLRKIRTFGDRLVHRFSEPLGPDGADYLTRMQAAAERMQRLIDDLLMYARISMRGQPFVPVDLGAVLGEVAVDLEVLLERTGGRIEYAALPTVMADPTQMRQLFQNLLGNALKFAAPGRAPVVSIHATTLSPGKLQIEVRDNGIGFEAQYAERIFEPFQRLHGRSEYDGTGIGLAICHRIVERHLGAIRAESTVGAGSRFLITLGTKGRAS